MDRKADDEAPIHGRQVPLRTLAALAALGTALCVIAAVLAENSPFGDRTGVAVVAHVLVIAAPIGAGLYAVSGRRASRFGWLLVLAGLVWAPTMLAESGNGVAYSLGRISAWIVEPMLIYLVLAFPSGRLTTKVDRGLFRASLLLLTLLYLPTVLLVNQFPLPSPWTSCQSGCPANAFMVTSSEPGVVGGVISPVRDILLVVLLVAITVVLARRVTHGTRLMRRTLAPVLGLAIVRIALTAVFILMRRASPDSPGTEAVGVIAMLSTPALALGFLAGLMRWRIFAVSAVRRLTTDFIGPPSGERVGDLLSAAFEDPSLEVVYWAPDPQCWVDAAGVPVRLPEPDSERAVTEVVDRGRRVAAFVHDRALADQPILSEVAGGFALVALENQRLDAELRSSLRELRESRVRIMSAADKERQRIERDLHDGAQQRLVALGIKLELARRSAEDSPGESQVLLREIGSDVDEALSEVRSLAHGVYPAQLADRGLADALRVSANGGLLPVVVNAEGVHRYPQEIESAVYFCCLEALQNAGKHAQGATCAWVTLGEPGGERLAFEVRDDGPGLPENVENGAGLDNMRDRIAAVGGSLDVGPAVGGGTRVAGWVPLGPAELPPELETLLRRATDALDDCFGIFRGVRDERGAVVDFLVEHVNEAACLDIGRPREEEIGQTLGELIPGYRSSPAFRWHRQVLAGSGQMSAEDLDFGGPFTDATHLQRAYDVRAAPLGSGRLVLSWREITERKRTELERRMQSLVLDRAAEGVCLVRASDAVIVYSNPRFTEIFGYEPGELDGSPASVLNWEQEPGDAERRAEEIRALLEPRGEASFEVHTRRKDGTPFWTDAHVTAFDDPDHGRVWVVVQQEIAHPVEAREPRSASDSLLREIIERVPLVAFSLDSELRYTWVFDLRSGLAADGDAGGISDEQLFGPAAAGAVTEVHRRVLSTGRGIRTVVGLNGGGSSGFELAAEPLRGSSGRVEGIAGVAFDPQVRD
jgi:PAS domain S-box-containing protein